MTAAPTKTQTQIAVSVLNVFSAVSLLPAAVLVLIGSMSGGGSLLFPVFAQFLLVPVSFACWVAFVNQYYRSAILIAAAPVINGLITFLVLYFHRFF